MDKKISIVLLVVAVVATIVFAAMPQTPATTEELVGTGLSAEPVVAEDVKYFEGATGYYARPTQEGDYPGVVMIHENRGLRPEIKSAAEKLAASGYHVLAVDLFGIVMETQEEARAFGATYDQERGLLNMQAAVAFLREQNASAVGSLGWCFGGAQSLALSLADPSINATVIYYGRLNEDQETLSALGGPVLGIFGDQDQVVPTSSVANFESALNAVAIPNEIYMYEGVGHAFANPSNPNFAPEPTADAWQKTLAFLERYLK